MAVRGEQAAATRSRILDAARAQFDLRSSDFTLDTVATAAGVSVQTVLRAFGSKHGLVIAAIGTDRAELLRESAIWRAYDLPPAIAARKWHGRYRGQTQRWLAMRFTGEDADIRLDAHEPEFGVWRWVPADRLVELIVPFKRAIYASVVEEFRPLWQPEAGLKQAEGR